MSFAYSDMTKLTPYGSGGGTSPDVTKNPVVCKGPASSISRVHYDLTATPIKPGEQFQIAATFLLPAAWGKGGVLMRVENYADTGQKLVRLELDIYRDGNFHLVKNQHINMGADVSYDDLGVVCPAIYAKQFEAKITGALGGTVIVSIGSTSKTFTGTTWDDNTKTVQRARYGLVQGPDTVAEARVFAASIVSPVTQPPVPPDPPPADPCADVKAQLASCQTALDAQKKLTLAEKNRADAAEAKISAAISVLG